MHSTVIGASPSWCSQCHGVIPTKVERTEDGRLFVNGKYVGLLAEIANQRELDDVKKPITIAARGKRRPAF